MSETPKTDALRALMAEIYEPDNAALDHMLEKYAELERETTPPEAPRRRLLDTDPHCPSCGHNRDTSSASSIDKGSGIHACQRCGADWLEIESMPSSPPRPSNDSQP